jgi:hypothetical protein
LDFHGFLSIKFQLKVGKILLIALKVKKSTK